MIPYSRLTGLIAATYTPMTSTGEVNLSAIPAMVAHLASQGIEGLYVCGSTGEGMSLSNQERKNVTKQYVEASDGKLPVIAQVGHNSLAEAQELAQHAQEIGVSVISATCPSYFKVTSVDILVDCMAEIASAAPELPFYYYHIPVLTGSSIDMVEFLQKGSQKIPNLVGLKYTAPMLFEFQECQDLDQGKFDILWGCDEMLLGALATGAQGAIGSTYNIAAPVYQKLIQAFEQGDLKKARRLQSLSVQMIRILKKYPIHSAIKEVLGHLGLPCGLCRLPQPPLSSDQKEALKSDLTQLGFYDW